MPNSMKQFITRKLKENVPLSEIKKDLKEKGYALEEINKAVREAIGGIDKKLPVHIIQIIVLLTGIAVAIGVGIYLTSSEKTTETVQTTKISPCDPFRDVTYKITCEEAIELASTNVTGTVQNISIGSVRVINEQPPPVFNIKDAWLITIKVDTPYFDQAFNKEVSYLRIGVDLNGDFIRKEVIDV